MNEIEDIAESMRNWFNRIDKMLDEEMSVYLRQEILTLYNEMENIYFDLQ